MVFISMVALFLMILWVFVLDVPILHKQHTVTPELKISNYEDSNAIKLHIKAIKQYPELPRGCEVTSLAMLLSAAGIEVDKLDLASKIKKDPTPYKKVNNTVYFGDPNQGFVGDMYKLNKPGFGVYHKPITELAEQYLPGRIIDLTGSSFESVINQLEKETPVWVIVNTTFKKLPSSYFQEWQTPNGKIKITRKEHAVLITGYDEQYIYVNDPLTGKKNMLVDRHNFVEAWGQIGKQAVSFTK
jgi:uncharacterized protein YvpB